MQFSFNAENRRLIMELGLNNILEFIVEQFKANSENSYFLQEHACAVLRLLALEADFFDRMEGSLLCSYTKTFYGFSIERCLDFSPTDDDLEGRYARAWWFEQWFRWELDPPPTGRLRVMSPKSCIRTHDIKVLLNSILHLTSVEWAWFSRWSPIILDNQPGMLNIRGAKEMIKYPGTDQYGLIHGYCVNKYSREENLSKPETKYPIFLPTPSKYPAFVPTSAHLPFH
tara:strand:+ start:50 stop:733 length:684 start_codon:yes stop_codon:yes gene_type:complete